MTTLIGLENKLKNSWSLKTCDENQRNRWSKHNTSVGQSDITATYVFLSFGGEVRLCYVNGIPHYFNKVHNKIIDLTKGQFGKTPIDYANSTVENPKKILDDPRTRQRYFSLVDGLHSDGTPGRI